VLSKKEIKTMLIVVIASYRYGHLAAHCIESVLSQTQKPDQIIFVDDGVGDCYHLVSLYPEVEFLFRFETLGTVLNFQEILRNLPDDSRVMYLGADNWIRDDCLELLSKSHADIVTYDIMVTGQLKNEILSRHPSECHAYQGGHYWDRFGRHHGSMLYNVALAKKCGGYAQNPNSSRTEEDWVLFNKMVNMGATVDHVSAPLLYYRRHKENFNPC
jgi:glycosyltransferase involved in cell wall biosynthesis